ncbi:MAG: exodeoxyribonuclease V subunit gamma [Ferruginibacter sp.]
MSLQLNVSNSLTNLAEQLATSLKEQAGNVFQKQYLVTQTEGMNNWLTITLAANMGISANCKFLKPNDIVNQLYYWLGGENKKVLGADHLRWLIYNLIGSDEFVQRFKTISTYYGQDDIKRIALAERVADLFDQYQVYRPEMVDQWNIATTENLLKKDWQKFIWIKVREKKGEELKDKSSVVHFIIQQLNDSNQQQKLYSRLPYIHIFGISIITPLHIYLFNELSKYISVGFYLLNPAPLVYWLDDRTEKQVARMARNHKKQARDAGKVDGAGNTLLISWGKVIQETFGLLFENDTFLNVYNDEGVVEPNTSVQSTLLQKIQQDIFYNNDKDGRNLLTPADLQDSSLTINSCYTPVREVEVLYNYLVHLVDQKKQLLSPRDIVVMVSDIDAYAPYIRAIFNTAPYSFPYTIADESYQSGDSLFTAVTALLSIAEDSFKAEEVMQLLDSKYIRERFHITDTALLRNVVSMANIRFGIEGSIEDDTILVSWTRGLQRIMYGICMSGETEYTIGTESIYPLDVVEGDDAQELIRFNHFIEVLVSFIQERSNKRNLAQWGEYIQQLVENLVFQSEIGEADEDYQRLLVYIENLNLLTETTDEPVSFEVFKHSFVDIIASETRSAAFASGGITFCSLIPMRSIPFKVVALLGMNFDKFPRRETPLSFNIMEQKRRKGDRNVKDNDKHLFLETILSAQQYLYISYIGRNPKDNSIHPPSALVDELVDYVASGFTEATFKAREILIVAQPLHGFSQKYFKQIPGLYSYLGDAQSTEILIQRSDAAKEPKSFEWDEIAISSLLAFFKNPFKWYYNKVLGIYYNEDDVLLPDTELFELDKLQEWQLKTDLLHIDDDAVQGYQVKALKTGVLPLKHMADVEVAATMVEIAPVKKILQEAVGDCVEAEIAINIQLGQTIIVGKLNGVYNDKLMVISFSKNHYRYLLETWIKYLLITAQGLQLDACYLTASKKAMFTIAKDTYSQTEAIEQLLQLVQWFKQGHDEIFLLYPGFSESPLKMAAYEPEKLNAQIGKYLERSPNEYLQKEFENGVFSTEEKVQQFSENTLALFSPVATLFPELM